MQTTHNQTEPSTTPSSAAKYQARLLTPQIIHEHWDELEPRLEEIGMKDHSTDTLYAALVDPNVRMYLVAVMRDGEIRALIGVELLETALQDRWLNISFVQGQRPDKWIKDIEPKVLDWAREYGCTRAVGNFRKAFKKWLPEWRNTHDYLEREL